MQSGRCVEISAWGTANGTKVQLWDYLGGTNQKFFFGPTTSGYYRIQAGHLNAAGSGLDVSGVSMNDGALVQLWQWLDGNNQQWIIPGSLTKTIFLKCAATLVAAHTLPRSEFRRITPLKK